MGVRFRAPARARPRATGSARPGCGLQAASSGSTPANASTSENGGNHSASNPPKYGHATAAHARAAHRATAPSNRTSRVVCHRHCAGGATPPHAPPARPSRRPRGRAAPPARAAPARRLRGASLLASLGRLGGPRLCVCVTAARRGQRLRPRRARGTRRRPRRERGRVRAEAAGPVSYLTRTCLR